MPSRQAAEYICKFNEDVIETQLVMMEVLGVDTLEALEKWIMQFVDGTLDEDAISMLGCALHMLGLSGLACRIFKMLNEAEMSDPALLYMYCEALLDSGQQTAALHFLERKLLPPHSDVIESDATGSFALLAIEVFSSLGIYERSLAIVNEKLMSSHLLPEGRQKLSFQRATSCILLRNNESAIASLDSLKLPKDHPDYIDCQMLRARASSPHAALDIYQKLLVQLGAQSGGARKSLGRSSGNIGAHPSSSSAADSSSSSPTSTNTMDVNGWEFKIKVAKLRETLKIAEVAQDLDSLRTACNELEFAKDASVSFIAACACVMRAWFETHPNQKRLPIQSSYLPRSYTGTTYHLGERRNMMDKVLVTDSSPLFRTKSSDSLGSSTGSNSSANWEAKPSLPMNSASSSLSNTNKPNASAGISAATLSSADPSSTSSHPPASPRLHRSRERRLSGGTQQLPPLQLYLSLSKKYFAEARAFNQIPAALVSQYRKVVKLGLYAANEEFATALKEQAELFLARCSENDAKRVPKVACLMSEVFRLSGEHQNAMDRLDEAYSQNSPIVRLERILVTVSNSSLRTSSSDAQIAQNAKRSHPYVVNDAIDKLAFIGGRYEASAQFHIARLYQDELGDRRSAKDQYNKILSKWPKHFESLYRRAFLLASEAHPLAVDACTTILNTYTNDIKVLEWRAGAYMTLSKYHLAIADYQRILRLDPSLTRIEVAKVKAEALLTSTGQLMEQARTFSSSAISYSKAMFSYYWGSN